MNGQGGPASCDLCRKLEGRPGSDFKPHRLHREKDLHPYKKANGITHSRKQSFKSSLPNHPLTAQEGEEPLDPR
jgi:hypothetical protein